MSNRRSKGKRITEFKDYERSTENNGWEVSYTRMTDIQLHCMNELSNGAFRLYIMMKDYAKGQVEFSYPHRIYSILFSNQGFKSARQELIDYGYIENFTSMANLRKENKYKFSSKWRERNNENIKTMIEYRKSGSKKQ